MTIFCQLNCSNDCALELKTKTAFNLTEVNVHPDTLRVNCSTQTGVRDEFDVVVLTMPVCQILQLNGSIQDHLSKHVCLM